MPEASQSKTMTIYDVDAIREALVARIKKRGLLVAGFGQIDNMLATYKGVAENCQRPATPDRATAVESAKVINGLLLVLEPPAPRPVTPPVRWDQPPGPAGPSDDPRLPMASPDGCPPTATCSIA